MKNILATASAVLICALSFATDSWTTYFKNEQIEILYRYSDCHDNANGIHQQKVLLKFINLQNKNVEVSFSKELTLSNRKTNNGEGKLLSVMLHAHEQKEGTCNEKKDNALFLFSKQLNFSSTELKKFDLKNISVNPIQ